jgi:methionyl aminopeptidase
MRDTQCESKTLGDIGIAVQNYVEANAFSELRICRTWFGRISLTPPKCLIFDNQNSGQKLRVGMVIAIEPMVNVGTWKTKLLGDNWTVVTLRKKVSAFEHTVAITENGTEVLTNIKIC